MTNRYLIRHNNIPLFIFARSMSEAIGLICQARRADIERMLEEKER